MFRFAIKMITFVANIEFYTYMNLFFCVEVLIYFAGKAVTFFRDF